MPVSPVTFDGAAAGRRGARARVMHRACEAVVLVCGVSFALSALWCCQLKRLELQLRREAERMSFAIRLVEAVAGRLAARA